MNISSEEYPLKPPVKEVLQQDLSMKGEDVAHFAFSNELKIAFIVYKDNTLEIKYYITKIKIKNYINVNRASILLNKRRANESLRRNNQKVPRRKAVQPERGAELDERNQR